MRTTSLEERVLICALADAGHSDREIAHQLGWKIGVAANGDVGGKRGWPV